MWKNSTQNQSRKYLDSVTWEWSCTASLDLQAQLLQDSITSRFGTKLKPGSSQELVWANCGKQKNFLRRSYHMSL